MLDKTCKFLLYLNLKIYKNLYVISQGSSWNLSFHKRMVSGTLIPGKLPSKVIAEAKGHK